MLVAGGTLTNLKVCDPLIVDFRRQQQFGRIESEADTVDKLYDRQSFIEQLEGRFLAFPRRYVPKDKDRLAFSLGPQVLQRPLHSGRTGEFSGGTGSGSQHDSVPTKTTFH
jgi:hypothetical protein